MEVILGPKDVKSENMSDIYKFMEVFHNSQENSNYKCSQERPETVAIIKE